MLFAVTCLDKPDSGHIRQENRPAHLEFAKAAGDKLKMGGPLLSDDGATMIGSMLVVEAADRAELGAWLEQDPYAKAGLFESVTVRPFKWLLPQAVG
ncbi:YciL protein [Caenispirillum salinarum AK4]|uniref:YciL protein n=1 Tax=Caenispirillum salinarum AK4 TaxID=1238182 RepID=K9H8I8_9PROT|nr:YciI family protein [Caenispirillum salinarum]EKV26928.1 YciL protein [Caenispirillum salinarum AK4]